ncbi:MAG: BLUF domain-containing protein, partial [Raineya sp.]|nr:BLUF domain-containing protein [Raineya sp.]
LSHILALYDKIKLDERHKDAVMLGLLPIKERSFPSWQMAGKSVDLNKIDFKSQLSSEEREEFENILAGKSSSAERVAKIIQLFFK